MGPEALRVKGLEVSGLRGRRGYGGFRLLSLYPGRWLDPNPS